MFGWLCRATYCSVVSTVMLGVSHAIQNKKKLQKFTQSDSVYLLYLLLCLVYHMLLRYQCYVCWQWCKIPYSSCIFSTVFVVACVLFIHGFFRCHGYWIRVFCCLFVVCILYTLKYICSVDYIELPVILYQVSTSMFGISYVVQNDKKLWNLHIG